MSEELTALWEPFSFLQNEIISIGFSLLLAGIFWFFRPQVKLIWGSSNTSYH